MRCLAGTTPRAAAASGASTSGRAAAVVPLPTHLRTATPTPTTATWSRPTPDRDQDWIKPSYVPGPRTQPDLPLFTPEEPRPLYAPQREFAPAERPESPAQYEPKEAPKMPERPRDPIPAGNPGGGKERPPGEEGTPPAREEPAPAPDKK